MLARLRVDRFADVRSCWPWDPGLCILPARESRELHRVPARRGSQLQTGPELITQSNCNQVPMDHNCQPARSTSLDRSANRLGVDRFADVRSCWPMYLSIEGTASSPGPHGIATANRLGVDHSMELQPGPHGIQGCALSPGPHGIATANRLGVDNSMELQPGSESIDLPTFAAAGPWIHPSMELHRVPAQSTLLDRTPTRSPWIAAAGPCSKVVHHAGA
jgi:hypothetical protein